MEVAKERERERGVVVVDRAASSAIKARIEVVEHF